MRKNWILSAVCIGLSVTMLSGNVSASETGSIQYVKEGLARDGEAQSGKCGLDGQDVSWTLQNGVLTIQGTGEISYYMSGDDQPWADFKGMIREIVMGEGITYIGYNAFADCYNLQKVSIPSSLKGIGDSVFYGCSSLTELNLGTGVTSLGYNVFCYSGLKSLTLPKQLTEISHYTLNYCDTLENIYVEPGNPKFTSQDGVLFTDNGKTLFRFPEGRGGAYTIPNGVTKVGDDAFFKCPVSSVNMPDSVQELGESVFRECLNLTALHFSEKIKEIPMWTTLYCTALKEVTLPKGLEKIAREAFCDCDLLETLKIPSGVISIGSNAFSEMTQIDWLNENNLEEMADGSYQKAAHVEVPVEESYKKAFEVLKRVNEERKKAGSPALKMDTEMLEAAMLRAAETALYWGHTRPNGLDCFTANKNMFGENIALGSTTAESVMNQWMNSPMHKSNILSAGFKSIGVGCVQVDGMWYWVQCFGEEVENAASAGAYKDGVKNRKITVSLEPEYYKAMIGVSKKNLKAGEKLAITYKWDNGYTRINLPASGLSYKSSNPSVVKVSNGKVIACGAGTAEISFYLKGCPEKGITRSFSVKNTESAKKVKVLYNANGGKITGKSKSVAYKGTYGKLESPKRKGYAFTGWYTKAKGGVKLSSSSKVTSSKTHSIYAHWEKLRVGQTSIRQAVNVSGRKIKVTVKALPGVKKYQMLFAENAKFTKGKGTLNYNGTVGTTKKLVKGKTYYVKVRGYRVDSTGAKIYGKFSAAKRVTIRK